MISEFNYGRGIKKFLVENNVEAAQRTFCKVFNETTVEFVAVNINFILTFYKEFVFTRILRMWNLAFFFALPIITSDIYLQWFICYFWFFIRVLIWS